MLHRQITGHYQLSSKYLKWLENESIFIIREIAASFDRPVMLYSIGKDSSVMLHLAIKAFYPAPLPFPLLHIDTGWKFKQMIDFRDMIVEKLRLDLISYKNPEGLEQNINPFDHSSSYYTHVMKTQALKDAIDKFGFDASLGGARRDEEKSRAKERIFSFRGTGHVWNPKDQRPELWNLFNTRINRGESMRVFPLSNWTEADIWQYIKQENIPIVPLYFASKRPVVKRNGQLIMVDDNRLPIGDDEIVEERLIRFRTLGCYPLTAAVESNAFDIDAVINETLSARNSERSGRLIDYDETASMEKKKRDGYF